MAIVYGANYGRPTLDLNFAKNKSLIDTVSGQNLVTFTRSSTGTYVDSDGLIKTASIDTPRFDHDPLTGVCNGLLIEESRTNLVTYSEQFDNASWINQNSTEAIDTSIATPSGQFNAYRLIDNSINGTHNVYQNTTIGGGVAATFSVYARAARLRYIRIGNTVSATDYAIADFDLQTATVTQTGIGTTGTVSNAFAQSIGNGWVRCSATFSTAGANRTASIQLLTSGTMGIQQFGTSFYTGSDNYVQIWGAQVEAGSFATSYIPTTASTVTRTADSASITGTNFSSWYNQTEGTFSCYGSCTNGVSTGAFLGLGAGTGAIYQGFAGSGSSRVASWWNNSVDFSTSNNALWESGVRITSAYNSSGRYLCMNNGSIATDSSLLPNGGLVRFGNNYNNSGGTGVYRINRITYYPTRLQDFQLQQLTK